MIIKYKLGHIFETLRGLCAYKYRSSPMQRSSPLSSESSIIHTSIPVPVQQLIMKFLHLLVSAIAFAALTAMVANANDPGSLQDFCVATNGPNGVFVNGKFCKDPALAKAEDFFLPGLNIARNTTNQVGSFVTPANVAQIPGLNTLGISMVRIDYAPYGGLNPPHTHPRATEILVVLEGTLRVGFVTSNPNNTLITKVLYKGDVFVFPIGLIHFQQNIGTTNAVAIAALSSQNPGVITIANALFNSKPPIPTDVLTKAFQVDKSDIQYLQSQFWWTNPNP